MNRIDPNGILTGRLDLQHIGILGVSLGGIVGAEACRLEPRVRACLLMDAPMPTRVVEVGLSQPSIWTGRPISRGASGDAPQRVTVPSTSIGLKGEPPWVPLPGATEGGF